MMIELARTADSGYPVCIADTALNWHFWVEGGSGSGKTTALMQMVENICSAGNRALVLNVNGSFGEISDENGCFAVIHVKRDGIPLPFLECLDMSDGTREDPDDVAEAVVEVFSQAERMGYAQRYLLSQAAKEAVMLREKLHRRYVLLKKSAYIYGRGRRKSFACKIRATFGACTIPKRIRPVDRR